MAKLNTTFQISSPSNLDGLLTLDASIESSYTYSSTNSDTVTVPVHPGTPTEVVPITAGDTYVYVKNTDPTNFVQVRRVVGPADYAKLHPGDFFFICVYDSMGMQLLADTGACVVEYVTFLKS